MSLHEQEKAQSIQGSHKVCTILRSVLSFGNMFVPTSESASYTFFMLKTLRKAMVKFAIFTAVRFALTAGIMDDPIPLIG